MSRSGDGQQEGEHREDNKGFPIEGAAGTVTPAMLEQLESRLVEKIVAQLAAQGDPKGRQIRVCRRRKVSQGQQSAVRRLVLKGKRACGVVTLGQLCTTAG